MHPNQLGQYTKIIRYAAILLSFFLAAKTIDVYRNNLELANDIKIRQQNITELNNEINYSQNYLSWYKSSIYAPIFVAYENWILKNPGEYRIKFELRQTLNDQKPQSSNIPDSAPGSWNHFFSILWERIKGKK